MGSRLDRDELVSHFDVRELPDGRIGPTDLDGWARCLDLLRSSGWQIEGVPAPDAEISSLFDPEGERIAIRCFVDRGRVQLNVLPTEPVWVDFDFAVAELGEQSAVNALAEAIRRLARSVGAPCVLSPAGGAVPVVRYDPTTDSFEHLVPPVVEPAAGDAVQITIVHTETGMCLTSAPFADWREVQDSFPGYKASLEMRSPGETLDYLRLEYGDDRPFTDDEVRWVAGAAGRTSWAT